MITLEMYTATYKKDGAKKYINVAAASYVEAASMADDYVEEQGGVFINLLRRENDVIVPEGL